MGSKPQGELVGSKLDITGSRHGQEEAVLSWVHMPSLSSVLESLLITIGPRTKAMMLAWKPESQKVSEENYLGGKKVLIPEDTDTICKAHVGRRWQCLHSTHN